MDTDIVDPSCSKWAEASFVTSAGHTQIRVLSQNGLPSWRASPMLSSTAADVQSDDDDLLLNSRLTRVSRRSPAPLSALSRTTHQSYPETVVAIPAHSSNISTTKDKDVVPVLNKSFSFRPPSPAPLFTGFSSTLSASPQHVPISDSNSRPYGHLLPGTLPPPPSVKRTASAPTMSSTNAPAATTVAPSQVLADVDALLAEIQASPEFRLDDDFSVGSFGDEPVIPMGDILTADAAPLFAGFLTASPFLSSPFSPMISDYGTSPEMTPISEMGTPYLGVEDSPLINDCDDFLNGDALFGGIDESYAAPMTRSDVDKSNDVDLSKLWTFSPALNDQHSFDPPSMTGPVIPPPPVLHRRPVIGATGTRKNVTPATLIDDNAPTQKRNYLTPSATSRKAVPDAFRKRLHSTAFVGDTDEVEPSVSDEDAIAAKRRHNTVAARKSRKRKLEYQQHIERRVDELTAEVTIWRERALMAQALLAKQGTVFSFESM
ncbi:unnamed protein product [Mycena citricolor]|uniref:BZIP domain-containing protein n=3 Tax=Mycena citricolor TaxID=2018698 RepID=A0AAD2K7T9_9AGAR|nr:unnamed protein product [Mycena citricolor]